MTTGEGQELEDRVFWYLDCLQDSGDTNMFGAGPYLQAEFGFSKREARDWVLGWMKTYSSRHAKAGEG